LEERLAVKAVSSPQFLVNLLVIAMFGLKSHLSPDVVARATSVRALAFGIGQLASI
jgi:hypothetical protein